MSIKLQEPQSIRAACVIAHNRFCIAVHELSADDPYSMILEYNGGFSQPWSRVDVRRNITAIVAPAIFSAGDRPFVAVSDEGDVYFLRQDVIREKIEGAGIYSDDADGSGSIEGVVYLRDQLIAYGSSGQMFAQSSPGSWDKVQIGDPDISRQARFCALAGNDQGDIYAVGTIMPQFWQTPEDLRAAQLEAAAAGDLERFEALSREGEKWAENQGFAKMESGFLAISKEGSWHRLDTPNDHVLRDIFVASSNEIWIVGGGGTILKGNIDDGFRNVAFKGDADLSLLSVTRFRDRMVIASGYELHWFDGHGLSSLKPTLDPSINGNVPTPLKVQAVDDLLYYFDYKHGVHTYDGNRWTEIEIPSELLDRDFKGSETRP